MSVERHVQLIAFHCVVLGAGDTELLCIMQDGLCCSLGHSSYGCFRLQHIILALGD